MLHIVQTDRQNCFGMSCRMLQSDLTRASRPRTFHGAFDTKLIVGLTHNGILKMGYALVTSACFGCHQIFSYNPLRVPSIRDPHTGTKKPICPDCVQRVNPLRVKNGLPPIEPFPDAYDSIDESELP
jgi:hypothetical protein